MAEYYKPDVEYDSAAPTYNKGRIPDHIRNATHITLFGKGVEPMHYQWNPRRGDPGVHFAEKISGESMYKDVKHVYVPHQRGLEEEAASLLEDKVTIHAGHANKHVKDIK